LKSSRFWRKSFPRNNHSRNRNRQNRSNVTTEESLLTLRKHLRDRSKYTFLTFSWFHFVFWMIRINFFLMMYFLSPTTFLTLFLFFFFCSGMQIKNTRKDGHCCYSMYLIQLGFPITKETIRAMRCYLADYMARNRIFFERYFLGRKCNFFFWTYTFLTLNNF